MNRRISFAMAGLLASTSTIYADTPFKGGPAAFGSNSTTSSTPKNSTTATQPPITKLNTTPPAPIRAENKDDETLNTLPKAVVPNLSTDVKAACIEVAWLQDPATYQLRLRADATGDAIVLTGFLPTDRLREKALAIAHRNAGTTTVVDQLVIHPPMALPAYVATDAEQKLLIQVALENTTPGLSSNLQITVDAQGVATISGLVQELHDRRKIIRGLQAIPGCQAIRYGLTVAAPSRVQTASATNTSAVPSFNLDVMGESKATGDLTSGVVPSVVLSPLTPPPVKTSTISAVTSPVAPAPVTPVFPTLPAPSSVLTEPKAPDILVPSEKKPVPVQTAAPVRNMVTTSSLSGLFPPGAVMEEPPLVLSSMLGQPVVRVQHTINLDVMASSQSTKTVITRPLQVTESSVRSSDIVPVQVVMPVEDLASPALIPVMPRLSPSK
jgi:hypothetical protein